jgi:hypothetical protein
MQQRQAFNRVIPGQLPSPTTNSRKAVVGLLLLVALLAFEIFNFDTTRFALSSILGDVAFLGVTWATILAIAFCAIDFAGLARLFTPQRGADEPKAVWYLMGAWLLGATMNAVMTWWAVSLTLLSHEFGNEVLAREQLLRFVPIFVAGLVLLTRILFIGAFSVAGEHIFDLAGATDAKPAPARQPAVPAQPAARPAAQVQPGVRPVDDTLPPNRPPTAQPSQQPPASSTRINSRPPMPSSTGMRPNPAPMQAKSRR